MNKSYLPTYFRTAAESADELLTVDEAHDELRISKWMVNELIRSHQLASIKIGRRRLIPRSAIRTLIGQLQAEEAA
jgi:excisionase family DNA binding protein